MFNFKKVSVVLGVMTIVLFGSVAYATHSWGGYHWARTANPFALKLGDNVSSLWDSYLAVASSDWSQSDILDTTIVSGNAGNPRRCRPTSGRVEVCNASYGNNGWLGIAQIWIDANNHITQGVTKMNDTYFNTAKYNTPSWRQFVMCQEVGHAFGLDHQDENFSNANLGTCMDYTNNPNGPLSNLHPNAHDYDELDLIYSHLDGYATSFASVARKAGFVAGAHAENSLSNTDVSDEREWGTALKHDGKNRASLYGRSFANGEKVFTFVLWAD